MMIRERIEEAVESLPPLLRFVTRLHYDCNLECDEIGRIIALPTARVEEMRFESIKRLREQLLAEGVIR